MNIRNMTLKQKIGQMLMCGFDGFQATKEIEQLIKNYHIGGVIYFRRNVSTIEQVHQLSVSLQEIAKKNGESPLFISIDQEGGMVNRINQGVTLFPGNMALGAAHDPNLAYQAAKISGEELRLMGINMNLAPCLDVNNNPANPVIGVRSFGDNATFVGDMGSAMVEGYQAANVSAVVKHFPGHGDTNVDSHLSLPVISHDLNRLNEVELVPFKQAIANGVDAVMTAHILFPAIESEHKPSTLSKSVITDLLRKELGFNGVVVSDCLEMNAILEEFGIAEGAVLAIEAGVDLLLVSHLYERQVEAFEAIFNAVQTGRISEKRIHQSVERILRLKQERKGSQYDLNFSDVQSKLRSETNLKTANEITKKCVTLLKDGTNQLPLDLSQKTLIIWSEETMTSPVDDVVNEVITLGTVLKQKMSNLVEYKIESAPTKAAMHQILEMGTSFKQIVMATYDAKSSPKQAELVKILYEKCEKENIKFIAAATRTPYDIQVYPEVRTYLACYENRPMMIEALADVLIGKQQAVGRCPVEL
ncbi:beta-N-acetylhexosaminidase [Chengkuizengella axinellae]|uniref:Beta-N-acetylhexosaminidase n=1 Tax=Chengkuizengella axinellae TaxID=3064388 RepID=A0ABT9J2J2_9BACL|nr:beta-N-acetylhexosaminidase [Chengkuizengella sp. 2205SS18-9]MDP5275657.1 beta-N-acetylhexosaminidase [Chengkuizengella sp. 2205SS18-9]